MLLKVGDLARRTGLTVRTLHHYDEVGLLKPSGRSDAGYRLYSQADVQRLHGIQTMRQMGIKLKLNPLRTVVAGTRLVVVDVSIVRGNTQRALVRMLREAGAAEVHVRISSPPGDGVDTSKLSLNAIMLSRRLFAIHSVWMRES